MTAYQYGRIWVLKASPRERIPGHFDRASAPTYAVVCTGGQWFLEQTPGLYEYLDGLGARGWLINEPIRYYEGPPPDVDQLLRKQGLLPDRDFRTAFMRKVVEP